MASRFFKPSFSEQVVPTYAPLPLDAVRYGAEKATQTWNTANEQLDTFSAAHQDMLSQLTPQNQEQAATLLQEDEAFIDRLTDPDGEVRYQDMIPLIRRQARKTNKRMQPYLQDSKKVREFQTNMKDMYDSGNLSLSLRNYYNRQLSEYGGLQQGEDGTMQGFKAPPLVRKVDINEQIDKYMDHLAGGNEQILVQEFGDPRFVKEITQKYRSEEDLAGIRSLIASRILNNPEAQQYMQAEWMAQNDALERSGEESVEFEDFVSDWVNPYAAAASMPQQTVKLRNNPSFNAEDYGIMSNRGAVPVKIGNVPLDFSNPPQLHQRIDEMEDNLELQTQSLLQSLPVELRENAYIGEDGKITMDNYFVDGVNRKPEIAELNAHIEQTRKQYEGYKAFDEELRKEAGLNKLDEATIQEHDELLQDAYNNWRASAARYRVYEDGKSIQSGEMTEEEIYNEFLKDPAYQRALERLQAPEYKKYMELYKDRTGQGQMNVKIPSQLTSTERSQYVNDLYRLSNQRVIYNAKDRSEYDTEEFSTMLANAARVEPLGPLTDSIEKKTYVAYNIYPKGDSGGMSDEGATTVLMDPGLGSYQAMLNSGMVSSANAGLYGSIISLGNKPGEESSTSIPVTEDVELKIELLPLDQQQTGNKYRIIYPTSDAGPTSRLVRNEEDALGFIRSYMNEGYKKDDT